MKTQYFVYILECADGTYYTGSTNDLKKRVHSHNNSKSGAKYTRGRRPVKLVYYEAYDDSQKARERERKLKQYGSAWRGVRKRTGYE